MAGRGPTWGPAVGANISTRAGLLPAGELLRERAEDLKAKLVVLDPLAAVWIGNENDRSLVRAFMADWDAWARRRECGVLVLAHEPKTRESGPAGSTDWEAAARAVWSLSKEVQFKGGPLQWKLTLTKANYGPPGAVLMGLETNHDSGRWRVDGPWDATEQQGGGSNANS